MGKKSNYKNIISYVEDRKAHDFRYAINTEKISKLKLSIDNKKINENLKLTYKWYVENI
tara:strand:- start:12423 stop:12599 length:177 start_codon:yes stop_codon:yes gene_type:complete